MLQMNKIMFAISMVTGTLISISSYSWLGMWMGLEMNLLSIIPLMSDSKNLYASEAALKYFITQAMASSILIFAIIINMVMESTLNNLSPNVLSSTLMNTALLTKMGAAPFHFWFPEIIDGLNWNNCLIMLTWQKIAPMAIMMYNIQDTLFLSFIILFCMIVSGIVGLNQISLRKIMAYSSINHMGWMIGSMMLLETIWVYYFLIYAAISTCIVIMLKSTNIFYMKQLMEVMTNKPLMKFTFILNFLSLGGLPPFLGFLPKWMIIQSLVESGLIVTAMIMVVMTLLTLFYYLRLSYSSLILGSLKLNISQEPMTPKLPMMMACNFIALSGLIFCTMMFNWM
uniref:NADH-ubiquinone oxidoreductase chain 2 n=1 Tax=Acmaeodera sp. NCS-2009 TaxID=590154 RepID=D1G5M2_9COLE|nr:NADH dehydrogenase subunit 2 [Acmaeodera sp. NCS-2009]ACM45037.1 NADH dehydrogenase subunit 2 [Acmaeodera sp. NCS-2009]